MLDDRNNERPAGLTYRDAGVNIDAGNRSVEMIIPHTRRTFRPGVLGDIGGFGGLFELDLARYRRPVLVSGTDGVGTKLKVAFLMGKHDTVGIDVVAYCVNDVIVQGAEPLFFLDYIGTGVLEPAVVADVVKGVAEGCVRAGCALIGGETAELPGFYAPGEYDLVGFAVGAVDRDRIIDGSRIAPGDAVIGIGSTGLQSSGFSLARKVLFEVAGYRVTDHVAELGCLLGEEMLTPTGIYARQILDLAERFDLRGIANITGGGFYDNIPRVLPAGARALLRRGTWPTQPIFGLIQREGRVEEREMFRTFNMGIAMVLVVPDVQADAVTRRLGELGERGYLIGEIAAGERGVEFA